MSSSRSRKPLGMMFLAAGALHFRFPEVYERIMPPYLPFHREFVYLSGAADLVLLAVWPANLQMLLDARVAGKPRWWTTLLLLRLPLQIPLMALVWRASRR